MPGFASARASGIQITRTCSGCPPPEWRRASRISSRPWLVFFLVAIAFQNRAAAWIPLADGEKGKLEIETRLMLWGVSAGRDTVVAGSPVQAETVRDFFVRKARLVLRARVSQQLEIFTQVGQDNIGGKALPDESGLRIKDLYLNYRFSDQCQVMGGQFKVPFLRQSLESAFNQLLVDRAALTALRPAREGSRDVGGMVWGNVGGLQYRAALFDGSDQEDTNPRSGFRTTVRLSHNWFTREPDFGHTGTTIGQKTVLQVSAQVDAQNDRVDPRDDTGFTALPRDYRAWAVELYYDLPFQAGWAVTMEGAWIKRLDRYEEPTTEDRTIEGFYAQTGLLLPGQVGSGRLQLAARYEDLETQRGGSDPRNTNRTLGINWFGKGHDRKIQLDYTDRRERPFDLNNDELRLSVVLVF